MKPRTMHMQLSKQARRDIFFFFFGFKCLLQLLWLHRKLPLKLVCVKQPLDRLTDSVGQEHGRDTVNRLCLCSMVTGQLGELESWGRRSRRLCFLVS